MSTSAGGRQLCLPVLPNAGTVESKCTEHLRRRSRPHPPQACSGPAATPGRCSARSMPNGNRSPALRCCSPPRAPMRAAVWPSSALRGRPSGARQPAATHPHHPSHPARSDRRTGTGQAQQQAAPRRRPLLSDVRPGQQQPCRRRRGNCCNSSTIGARRGPLRLERRRSAAQPPERPCKPSVHPPWLQDEGDPRRWAPSSGEVRHHALLPAPSRLRPLGCAPGRVRSAMGRRTRPRPSGLLPRRRRLG